MNKANDPQQNHSDAGPQPRLTKGMIARYMLAAVGCLLLVIAGLTIASRWLNTQISDRVGFVTGNLLNALIFAAIVAQVLIYRKQRDIMEGQHQAMLDGLTRTDRVIDKMQNQLDAINRQEGHLLTQSIAARIQAETAQGQLQIMESQEQAMRDALEETRRTVRYSEAAYIAIKDGLLIQFGPNQITVAKLWYTNAGNTPAYNVRLYGHLNLAERFLVPVEHDKLKEGYDGLEMSQDLVAPNGERTHTIASRGPLTEPLFQEIKAGRFRFYVWGIITYEDIFGRQRWTTFCSMQVGDGTALYGCGSNNDADR